MNFIAIDVATANANMASICQIGLITHQDGVVVEEWSGGQRIELIDVVPSLTRRTAVYDSHGDSKGFESRLGVLIAQWRFAALKRASTFHTLGRAIRAGIFHSSGSKTLERTKRSESERRILCVEAKAPYAALTTIRPSATTSRSKACVKCCRLRG